MSVDVVLDKRIKLLVEGAGLDGIQTHIQDRKTVACAQLLLRGLV